MNVRKSPDFNITELSNIHDADISYNVGIRRITGSGALPGCIYLIVKKSDYHQNRLKLKPEL